MQILTKGKKRVKKAYLSQRSVTESYIQDVTVQLNELILLSSLNTIWLGGNS